MWHLPKALKQGRLIALIVLVGILAIRTADPLVMSLLRFRSFDLLQQLSPRIPKDTRPVTIVDIDDESLKALGQWPWPRTTLAQIVDRLTQMGATVIGFDVMFAEPDRTSPTYVAESFKLDPPIRDALAKMPSHDELFATAIKNSKVVLGEAAKERDIGSNDGPAYRTPIATLGGNPREHLMHYRGIVRATDILETAAAGRGMLTIAPDRDGIVRRVPLIFNVANQMFPALTFEMLRIATGESVMVHAMPSGIAHIMVGKYMLPTDHRGQVWVHFARHEKQLYVSAKAILDGTVDPSRIAGKMIVIGTSASGLGDIKTTPLDAALPGVEIHAQLLESIINSTFLTRPDWADGLELVLTALVGILMIVLVPITGPRLSLLILVAFASLVAAGTAYLYLDQDFMLDGSLPIIAAVTLYSILVYANLRREERQRRQIRSAFGQYLSSDLVEQLADDPSKLKLGGERRNMTFLFSDIRGFTAISERYKDDPESLTSLINRYMTPMTNAILDWRGTIDKYMGDAIMAFWNAPLSDASHPVNACLAAIEMNRRLAILNEALRAEAQHGGHLPHNLAIGIGINTGDCIVGNMGSTLRFDYSVLGDAVNLAARLETQSKNYGVTIVIGEETERHIPNFATIELDLIAVKGKREAVRIFTIAADGVDGTNPKFIMFRSRHNRMLDAYRARQWENASIHLAACRAMDDLYSFTKLYDLYEARIAKLVDEPPPLDWDGVYVAESK